MASTMPPELASAASALSAAGGAELRLPQAVGGAEVSEGGAKRTCKCASSQLKRSPSSTFGSSASTGRMPPPSKAAARWRLAAASVKAASPETAPTQPSPPPSSPPRVGLDELARRCRLLQEERDQLAAALAERGGLDDDEQRRLGVAERRAGDLARQKALLEELIHEERGRTARAQAEAEAARRAQAEAARLHGEELAAARGRLAKLEAAASDGEGEAARRAAAAAERLAEATARLDESEAARKAMAAQLEAAAADARARTDGARAAADEAASQLADLRRDRQAHADDLAAAERERRALQRQVSEQQEQLARAHEIIDAAERRVAAVMGRVEEEAADHAATRRRLAYADGERQSAEALAKRLSAQLQSESEAATAAARRARELAFERDAAHAERGRSLQQLELAQLHSRGAEEMARRMEHELHVRGDVAPGVSVVDGSAPLYWYRAPEHMFRYSTLGAEKTVERPPWRVFDE